MIIGEPEGAYVIGVSALTALIESYYLARPHSLCSFFSTSIMLSALCFNVAFATTAAVVLHSVQRYH